MDPKFLPTLVIVLLTETVSAVIIIGPEDVLIEDITSANLTCVGAGTILTAEWRKDGQSLPPTDRIQFSTDNTSVLIRPVKRTDSGEYSCTLSNSSSSNTTTYSLTVNYGPDVKMLGPTRVEEGSDVLLYCFADSFPIVPVTWIVNGVFVRAALLFIIQNSNHSNSGNYTCSAFNDVTGVTASAEHFLTVTGKETDSGLSPGAAAGIAVAVILGVEAVAVGLFFLIMHIKKPSEPICHILKPKDKQKRKPPRSSSVQEMKSTEFKTQQAPSKDTPIEQSERPPEPLYERGPPVPRNLKPTIYQDVDEDGVYCTKLPGC